MTTVLTKYDAACKYIAEAATVDEVKYFHDEAVAMAAYAVKWLSNCSLRPSSRALASATWSVDFQADLNLAREGGMS